MPGFDPQQLYLWQNFYVVIGSAAAALVGVQFVVITLLATLRKQTDLTSVNAFGTPNVVHFGGALTIAAIMLIPWHHRQAAVAVLALGGLAGLAYCYVIHHRTRRQTSYTPILEDWIWHVIAPVLIHGMLTVAALLVLLSVDLGLFLIAITSLALLLLGVRNAWDSVTHIVTSELPRDESNPPRT